MANLYWVHRSQLKGDYSHEYLLFCGDPRKGIGTCEKIVDAGNKECVCVGTYATEGYDAGNAQLVKADPAGTKYARYYNNKPPGGVRPNAHEWPAEVHTTEQRLRYLQVMWRLL